MNQNQKLFVQFFAIVWKTNGSFDFWLSPKRNLKWCCLLKSKSNSASWWLGLMTLCFISTNEQLFRVLKWTQHSAQPNSVLKDENKQKIKTNLWCWIAWTESDWEVNQSAKLCNCIHPASFAFQSQVKEFEAKSRQDLTISCCCDIWQIKRNFKSWQLCKVFHDCFDDCWETLKPKSGICFIESVDLSKLWKNDFSTNWKLSKRRLCNKSSFTQKPKHFPTRHFSAVLFIPFCFMCQTFTAVMRADHKLKITSHKSIVKDNHWVPWCYLSTPVGLLG